MEADATGARERIKSKLKMRLLDLLETQRDGNRSTSKRSDLENHLRHALRALPPEDLRIVLPGREGEDHLVKEILNEILSLGPDLGKRSAPPVDLRQRGFPTGFSYKLQSNTTVLFP